MEIDLYKDFCLNISSNSKEIIERIYSLPYEISHKILNEFSTRILKTKIHPILQDEIYMTSFPGYRQFWRSERDYMGKYMNKSRIRTLIHIYVFMDTSIVLDIASTSNNMFHPSGNITVISNKDLQCWLAAAQ